MQTSPIEIVNGEADQHFRTLVRQLSMNPGNMWIGGYVDYQWTHDRYLLEKYNVAGKTVLEFGCNVGATAIVLARLGANVIAIDVDADIIEVSRANAQRYGVEKNIRFLHIPDTTQLPFETGSFDLVTAMSVLEYVPPQQLPKVQKEIDRVLRHDGVILVTGTSNRLWPREVHSRSWFVNYLPLAVDSLLSPPKSLQRGVFPHQIRHGFGDYINLDLLDSGAIYFEAKAKMQPSSAKLNVLRLANRFLNKMDLSVGLYTPSISVALRKNH